METSVEVLYEDNHLIAVNKRSSQLVQGDKTGDKPLVELVKDYIKVKYNKPGDVYLGVVHRIDRPVSGVVVFAKTSKALARLNKMFQDKEMQKTYWTVTREMPPKTKDTITHFLVRNPKQNKSFAHDKKVPNSKESSLTYEVKGKSDSFYFLEITPHTGRHHQIRTQLSKIGCPIKGDLKYGAKRSNKDASIHLHARKIEFIHPVQKEPLIIKAVPPNDVVWNDFYNRFKD